MTAIWADTSVSLTLTIGPVQTQRTLKVLVPLGLRIEAPVGVLAGEPNESKEIAIARLFLNSTELVGRPLLASSDTSVAVVSGSTVKFRRAGVAALTWSLLNRTAYAVVRVVDPTAPLKLLAGGGDALPILRVGDTLRVEVALRPSIASAAYAVAYDFTALNGLRIGAIVGAGGGRCVRQLQASGGTAKVIQYAVALQGSVCQIALLADRTTNGGTSAVAARAYSLADADGKTIAIASTESRLPIQVVHP